MNQLRAIGFDLFNTLITFEPEASDKAMDCLISDLRKSYPSIQRESFEHAHWDAAIGFIKKARLDNRETHNRFWISAALKELGYEASPDDPRVATAVDNYFSAFPEYCCLIPGTGEMLNALKGSYRLGLLSNFTHAPAAREIIDVLGLNHFFDVVLISGELGYRKPHPLVFGRLVEGLGVESGQTLFVGDDPEPDISGAMCAGLHPVWMTYVRDQGLTHAREKGPGFDVPRISCWKDLLSLLKGDNI